MDFKNIEWKEGIEPLLSYLHEIKEDKYRDFSRKITPGEFEMLGVRIPTLKKIAKEISKGDYEAFLKLDTQNIYELKIIKGFVIGNIKDLNSYKKHFEEFLPLIDNWAVCDTFLASSKIIKKDLPYFFNRSLELLKTDDEYLTRVAFVTFLDYHITDDYYKKISESIADFKSDKYYSNMALAWLLSVLYVKYPVYTQEYLLKNPFDDIVIKYTIRKIKDSYRVSQEDKEWLKNLQK